MSECCRNAVLFSLIFIVMTGMQAFNALREVRPGLLKPVTSISRYSVLWKCKVLKGTLMLARGIFILNFLKLYFS